MTRTNARGRLYDSPCNGAISRKEQQKNIPSIREFGVALMPSRHTLNHG